MSQSVNAPSRTPENVQTPIFLTNDDIIVSKRELHSLRFRVKILKKFLNRLSLRIDALTFQKETASPSVEVH